ncbi:metallopeptidase family M24 [Macrophomina phaseolina]|uniref:Metallopeptidase family M24 n=1 Tax=Macrophomina phaseolina TaxID=35725 RepID=A0ABQ8FYX5_9PEZI|nr:metallopeptidase family M24 [Macrophomina phaseolina]
MKGGTLESQYAPAPAAATHTRATRTRRSVLKLFTALLVLAAYARLFYVSTHHQEKRQKNTEPQASISRPQPLSRLHSQTRHSHAHTLHRVQQCTLTNLHANLSFLGVSPIASADFLARRDALARALHAEGVDAFALEPGYTFQYYGNVSQQDWEPWEPEERPMLMLVQPVRNASTGAIVAKTSFLSPAFEEGRVRMLGIPAAEGQELDIVTWEEHWNPYETLRRSRLFAARESVTVMVDEEMRDYIVRGLAASGFETVGLRGEVEAVRQIKTDAEVELIRAVNTGTVEAVRAMRPCLVPGLIEDEVMEILDNSLLSIGFSLFFDIVLFEENGALPHGGFVTGGKVLKEDSVVLIDVGAHYLGYSSDICRSFFIPTWEERSLWEKAISIMTFSKPSSALTTTNSDLYAEKLKVWDIVLEAQTESAKMFKPNNSAASVDIAARTVISDAGYGEMFTHRVGHGIGIKAHESPYLNKGNHKVLLKPGMTFTSEPGIYMLNKFGVRHEDIYVVREEGEAELLTGKRAVSPWEP